MCWPREIIPGVCDITQRPGIIALAAQTLKDGAICVNVQGCLRPQIAAMVASSILCVFVGFTIPFHRLALPFLSRPKL